MAWRYCWLTLVLKLSVLVTSRPTVEASPVPLPPVTHDVPLPAESPGQMDALIEALLMFYKLMFFFLALYQA